VDAPPEEDTMWLIALMAAFAAALANLAVFMFAKIALHLPLRLAAGPGARELVPLTVGAVVTASVVPALVATGAFAALRRLSRRPFVWFVAIAGAILAVSFVPVGSVAVDDMRTRIVLGLLHVVAALAIVGVIAATARRGSGAEPADRRWRRIVPTILLGSCTRRPRSPSSSARGTSPTTSAPGACPIGCCTEPAGCSSSASPF
jgi:hypothetical protein